MDIFLNNSISSNSSNKVWNTFVFFLFCYICWFSLSLPSLEGRNYLSRNVRIHLFLINFFLKSFHKTFFVWFLLLLWSLNHSLSLNRMFCQPHSFIPLNLIKSFLLALLLDLVSIFAKETSVIIFICFCLFFSESILSLNFHKCLLWTLLFLSYFINQSENTFSLRILRMQGIPLFFSFSPCLFFSFCNSFSLLSSLLFFCFLVESSLNFLFGILNRFFLNKRLFRFRWLWNFNWWRRSLFWYYVFKLFNHIVSWFLSRQKLFIQLIVLQNSFSIIGSWAKRRSNKHSLALSFQKVHSVLLSECLFKLLRVVFFFVNLCKHLSKYAFLVDGVSGTCKEEKKRNEKFSIRDFHICFKGMEIL